MKSLHLGMAVSAIVLGTMTALAVENTARSSGSMARGTDGYTVTVPAGGNWTNKSTADGAVYENAIAGGAKKVRVAGAPDPGPSAFYRAGFSAASAPAFSSRQDFLAYVK